MPGDQPPLLEITVGTEGFRFGEVAVAVRPEGEIEVRQRRSGVEREWHGRADDDGAVDLAALTAAGGPREPDDEPVHVRAGGGAVELRWSDRFRDPAVDALLDRWAALATAVTGGELP